MGKFLVYERVLLTVDERYLGRHLCCENSKNLHPLDILACNKTTNTGIGHVVTKINVLFVY